VTKQSRLANPIRKPARSPVRMLTALRRGLYAVRLSVHRSKNAGIPATFRNNLGF
jgi:hypothetical protein